MIKVRKSWTGFLIGSGDTEAKLSLKDAHDEVKQIVAKKTSGKYFVSIPEMSVDNGRITVEIRPRGRGPTQTIIFETDKNDKYFIALVYYCIDLSQGRLSAL